MLGGGSKRAKNTDFGWFLRFKPRFCQPPLTGPTKLAVNVYLVRLQHPTKFQAKILTGKCILEKNQNIDFFSLIIDKSQHFNKHNIQSRRIWETPLKKTFQYSDLLSQNWTESFELAKKFIKILSNPVQIWLSRNGKIQIYQNTRTRQDFNEVHVHLWSFYGHVKDISCKKLG